MIGCTSFNTTNTILVQLLKALGALIVLQLEVLLSDALRSDDVNLSEVSGVNISFSGRAQCILNEFDGLLQRQSDGTVQLLVSASNLKNLSLEVHPRVLHVRDIAHIT